MSALFAFDDCQLSILLFRNIGERINLQAQPRTIGSHEGAEERKNDHGDQFAKRLSNIADFRKKIAQAKPTANSEANTDGIEGRRHGVDQRAVAQTGLGGKDGEKQGG